jgi:hypothetical protein
VMPASIAHRISSVPTVFVTATRDTPSGFRPERVAATAMRERTSATFRRTTSRSADTLPFLTLGLTLGDP